MTKPPIEQKMNPELKAKWIAALRSGNYKQGKGQLRNRLNQFCCLGVLCDIMDPTGWSGTTDSRGDYRYKKETAILPPKATYEAGIPTENQVVLSEANDKGASFDDLSHYIEQYL